MITVKSWIDYDVIMNRPSRFEEFQYLGDKRTQVVYDLDAVDDDEVIATITQCVAEGKAIAFGPDSLAEARNRGYCTFCDWLFFAKIA